MVFPFYHALVTDVFLPNAALLGWGVMLGELLAGVAILVGMFSNAALLGGLFMNLNFVLAGVPNPSAFYIIIQLTLFTGGVGAIVGMDAFLGRHLKTPLSSRRTPPHANSSVRRNGHFRRWHWFSSGSPLTLAPTSPPSTRD